MILSDKYKEFMRHRAAVEVLEGTTQAGKTTVGAVKFMLRVAESSKSQHILSGLDLGTIEKNIVNSELGIVNVFGGLAEYRGNGSKDFSLPHLVFKVPGKVAGSEKIVFTLGYDDKTRWKKALGGQYGCVMIDEANIANTEFVREVAIRQDYLMLTLNPDNPDLDIYKDFVNHSRPLDKYIAAMPQELYNQLDKPQYSGWTHWYFTFDDNPVLTKEKREQLLMIAPPSSKLYKNKILGLRGRATGLVFDLEKDRIVPADVRHDFVKFSCGIDTSYSKKTNDTFSFIFTGITSDKKIYVLDELVLNNKDRAAAGKTPYAPSDIVPLLFEFLEANRNRWGFARDVFIDCADTATIGECEKYKRQNGCLYNFIPSWKKMKIIDRINLMHSWLKQGCLFILSHCKHTIGEFNTYSWKEDKDEPEDANDHCINGLQYAFLPFKHMIGIYSGIA